MCAPVSELYQHAVSGRLDEPAVTLGKCGVDDLASKRLQRGELRMRNCQQLLLTVGTR